MSEGMKLHSQGHKDVLPGEGWEKNGLPQSPKWFHWDQGVLRTDHVACVVKRKDMEEQLWEVRLGEGDFLFLDISDEEAQRLIRLVTGEEE